MALSPLSITFSNPGHPNAMPDQQIPRAPRNLPLDTVKPSLQDAQRIVHERARSPDLGAIRFPSTIAPPPHEPLS